MKAKGKCLRSFYSLIKTLLDSSWTFALLTYGSFHMNEMDGLKRHSYGEHGYDYPIASDKFRPFRV